jgi:hypothetical protein
MYTANKWQGKYANYQFSGLGRNSVQLHNVKLALLFALYADKEKRS